MTTKEFIVLSATTADDVKFEQLSKPYTVANNHLPDTLNDLSMGDLMMLQSISNEHEFIFMPCKILLGMDEKKVLRADASEVIGFSVWVAKEIQRINKLFASTSVAFTSEERQAGAGNMNFGPFGMVDYYAQRMGIHDHKQVEDVPWIIVYKCLDMDAKRLRYERRLRHIMSKRR